MRGDVFRIAAPFGVDWSLSSRPSGPGPFGFTAVSLLFLLRDDVDLQMRLMI